MFTPKEEEKEVARKVQAGISKGPIIPVRRCEALP
jgi:hypothetical protein